MSIVQTSSYATHAIKTIAELEAIYGEPMERSLSKEIDYISEHYKTFIETSPFVVIASVGPEGMDCSPRGDPAGFVQVADANTVLIPDRRGNNRIDTLRNIVRDARVSLLFLIPGIGETLRINGRATISVDPALCERFKMNDKLPRSVICVTAERVYFQCQKALARSRLWQADAQVARSAVPSAGAILQTLSDKAFDGEEYDRNYPQHMRKTIY
ncbi:MAG: PPOX class probable FMN-dependent enzyme [Gammaproteobacteria bacterium]|jgi:PPOX class probable FMN-dependent enzyme